MTATTLKRARAGYDPEFRRKLADAVLTAIAEKSIVTDAAVMAVRTSETMDALADILIAIMALVPNFDTPSELRKATDALAKRVRHEVARARAEGVGDILGASRWSGHA
jgi:hypothetical protein